MGKHFLGKALLFSVFAASSPVPATGAYTTDTTDWLPESSPAGESKVWKSKITPVQAPDESVPPYEEIDERIFYEVLYFSPGEDGAIERGISSKYVLVPYIGGLEETLYKGPFADGEEINWRERCREMMKGYLDVDKEVSFRSGLYKPRAFEGFVLGSFRRCLSPVSETEKKNILTHEETLRRRKEIARLEKEQTLEKQTNPGDEATLPTKAFIRAREVFGGFLSEVTKKNETDSGKDVPK